MTPEIGAKIYLKRLKEQIECYEEIVKISKSQRRIIIEGIFEKLPEKVKERNKVLRRLDVIQYVIEAYGNYWTKVTNSIDENLNESIARTLDKLHDVLKELENYDKDLKQTSNNELERIKNELTIIKCNRVKLKSFKKPISKPEPTYVNRLSIAL